MPLTADPPKLKFCSESASKGLQNYRLGES